LNGEFDWLEPNGLEFGCDPNGLGLEFGCPPNGFGLEFGCPKPKGFGLDGLEDPGLFEPGVFEFDEPEPVWFGFSGSLGA
jgi:hypothetical protein